MTPLTTRAGRSRRGPARGRAGSRALLGLAVAGLLAGPAAVLPALAQPLAAPVSVAASSGTASSGTASSGTAVAPAGASAASHGRVADGSFRACAHSSDAVRHTVGCYALWSAGTPVGARQQAAALARATALGHRVAAATSTTAAAASPTPTPSPTPTGPPPLPKKGLRPADIAAIYGLDPAKGAGQTVAIVDAYDNPNAEADLAVYRSSFGLPACTTDNGCFRKVNQRGGTKPPVADAGWGVEIALDLQAVSSACPACKILLVEADDADLKPIGAAVTTAVKLGADVVSHSYGTDEFNGAAALGTKFYSAPGVPNVVSSGDWGFTAASFPAVLPSSIAVGGTKVTKSSSGAWTHTAWRGAGSGCSAWFAKPAWQHDTHCGMRVTSDVSAVADPLSGLAVYDTFGLGAQSGWIVVGGTSLSAPLVAGMVGASGHADSIKDASGFYAATTGITDVVGGSNGYCGGDYLCTGVKGYDGPTGVGTPSGLSAF